MIGAVKGRNDRPRRRRCRRRPRWSVIADGPDVSGRNRRHRFERRRKRRRGERSGRAAERDASTREGLADGVQSCAVERRASKPCARRCRRAHQTPSARRGVFELVHALAHDIRGRVPKLVVLDRPAPIATPHDTTVVEAESTRDPDLVGTDEKALPFAARLFIRNQQRAEIDRLPTPGARPAARMYRQSIHGHQDPPRSRRERRPPVDRRSTRSHRSDREAPPSLRRPGPCWNRLRTRRGRLQSTLPRSAATQRYTSPYAFRVPTGPWACRHRWFRPAHLNSDRIGTAHIR